MFPMTYHKCTPTSELDLIGIKFGKKFLTVARILSSKTYFHLFSTTVPNILLQPTDSHSTLLLYKWLADSRWRYKQKMEENMGKGMRILNLITSVWKRDSVKNQHFQIPIRSDAGPPWKPLSGEWSFLGKYH